MTCCDFVGLIQNLQLLHIQCESQFMFRFLFLNADTTQYKFKQNNTTINVTLTANRKGIILSPNHPSSFDNMTKRYVNFVNLPDLFWIRLEIEDVMAMCGRPNDAVKVSLSDPVVPVSFTKSKCSGGVTVYDAMVRRHQIVQYLEMETPAPLSTGRLPAFKIRYWSEFYTIE